MVDDKTLRLSDILLTIRDIVYKNSQLPTLYSNDYADELTMCIASVLKLNEEALECYPNINLFVKEHEFDFDKHENSPFERVYGVGIKLREEDGESVFALRDTLEEIEKEIGRDNTVLEPKEREVIQKIVTKIVDDVLDYDKDSPTMIHRLKKCRNSEDRTGIILEDGVGSYHDIFYLWKQAIYDPNFNGRLYEEYEGRNRIIITQDLFELNGLGGALKNPRLKLNLEEIDPEYSIKVSKTFKRIFEKGKNDDLSLEF